MMPRFRPLSGLLCLVGMIWADAARAEDKQLTLTWDKIPFAYGYRVQIRDTRRSLVFNRVALGNRLRLRLPRGEYQHRLTVLNKFRKPAGQTEWRTFSTAHASVHLDEKSQAAVTQKHKARPPAKQSVPTWTRWFPGSESLYSDGVSTRLLLLGGLTTAGLFATTRANGRRLSNANDPLQRFFREPALYLAVRDQLTAESLVLLFLPARADLQETRRLLRRDERILYASLAGLGILYFYHFNEFSFFRTRSAHLDGLLNFALFPLSYGRVHARFAWHLRF